MWERIIILLRSGNMSFEKNSHQKYVKSSSTCIKANESKSNIVSYMHDR